MSVYFAFAQLWICPFHTQIPVIGVDVFVPQVRESRKELVVELVEVERVSGKESQLAKHQIAQAVIVDGDRMIQHHQLLHVQIVRIAVNVEGALIILGNDEIDFRLLGLAAQDVIDGEDQSEDGDDKESNYSGDLTGR